VPPRSCHELNPADLIQECVRDVRIRGIMRFELGWIVVGAISNPSVSAKLPGPRSLVNTGIAGHWFFIGTRFA